MVRFRLAALISIAASLAAGCANNAAPAVTPSAPLAADVIADARSLDQPSNAARVEAVQTLLRKRGLPFSLQTFPNASRQRDPREQGTNVIVDLPGPAGPEIIVGAHLDAAALKAGGYSHGMVDNGAGVIVLMRAAEALRKRQLRHRVRIVFFDMEEIGLAGSRYFASLLDKASVAAMVNVDIAGYGDTILSGAAPGAESLRQALARVCAARNYACLGFPFLPNSDDRSFQAAGIPAISLAVLPALEAHQIWLLLNGGKESGLTAGFAPSILRTIHTPEDTADKLTPQGMTLIYDTVVGLVLELDAR
jgi:Zn-dependent M28 family amino/carboxypeptidase